MKKIVIIDERAEKELKEFSKDVLFEFRGHFKAIEIKGKLSFPDSKKIKRNLFEIRVDYGGIYRSFYAYVGGKYVVILHAFRKKTQKTPIKNLKIAERRLREYERQYKEN